MEMCSKLFREHVCFILNVKMSKLCPFIAIMNLVQIFMHHPLCKYLFVYHPGGLLLKQLSLSTGVCVLNVLVVVGVHIPRVVVKGLDSPIRDSRSKTRQKVPWEGEVFGNLVKYLGR